MGRVLCREGCIANSVENTRGNNRNIATSLRNPRGLHKASETNLPLLLRATEIVRGLHGVPPQLVRREQEEDSPRIDEGCSNYI